ncbi:MAG TPA: hypothetical protein VGF50_07210 [Caulobacteraceae bacterium]
MPAQPDGRQDNVQLDPSGTAARSRTRKVWVTPRLETSSVAEDTLTGPANTNDGGGAGSSVS